MNQGRLLYVKGNVLEPQKININEFVVIPHCCNNIGVMGAGVALGIRKKWPEAVASYFSMAQAAQSSLKNMLGDVFYGVVEDGNILIANMIGQDGVRGPGNEKPVKYWALVRAMQDTLACAGVHANGGKVVFHCPKFGSALAGGKWELIEELIKETWVDIGCDVVIYEFEPDKLLWGPLGDYSIDVYNAAAEIGLGTKERDLRIIDEGITESQRIIDEGKQKGLWKTEIIIWTEENPFKSHTSLEDLARDATNGGSYCSKQESTHIPDAKADKDWDGTEFFDIGEDEL